MSGTLFVLVVLAAPGLVFDIGRRFYERVSNRFARDVVRLISEIILVAAPCLLIAYFVLDYLGNGLGQRVLSDLTREWGGQCARGCTPHQAVQRISLLVLAASSFALLFGLIYGKLSVWFLYRRLSVGNFAQRLTAGYRPPVVIASVMAVNGVSSYRFIYRGVLQHLQIGPEGRVDYVVLVRPEKSVIVETPDKRPSNILEEFKSFRRSALLKTSSHPRTLKPFVRIGTDESHLDVNPTNEFGSEDQILIESEDIANIFFRSAGLAKGDILDRIMDSWFGERSDVPPPPEDDLPPSQKKEKN